ncbi:hypothetical protein Ngar_c05860 [Candidatus Nitrososphaera gargensis Ga9.2]|uniref:Uncharacterized protein n=1 Tax=Nitrososphaera gargensis (strain Ga9.2) TaxID=1237085 RepID=K0IM34_NITGG|nr:hypothetical protein Ngar_c05860 [Candidatus Nitrososphaera gargensis Ga9.2]
MIHHDVLVEIALGKMYNSEAVKMLTYITTPSQERTIPSSTSMLAYIEVIVVF